MSDGTWRGRATARTYVIILVAALATAGFITTPATADDDPSQLTWSTSMSREETVTVTETATVDGFEGTGTATATKTATATGSATGTTFWEVYYYAVMDAWDKAGVAAREAADAEARPIAKQRAEADAQAKADAAKEQESQTPPPVASEPNMITWSTTATREETVTVTETATVNGFEGTGTATVTKSATATGTATAATNWEVYYYATVDANNKASEQAKSEAEAEARELAKQRALADAQAQADAAAEQATDPDVAPRPSGPSCGSTEVTKTDGTPWTCTFGDDFRGTSLDTTKWTPIKTETSQFSYGDCFLGAGPNIQVADGSLRLITRKEASPVTCRYEGKDLTTDYTSASVTSLGSFSQTYGRVEIRAAMPQTSGPGLQSALWMIPDDPTRYGGWPHSGEIDIAEFYSQYADRLIPTLHYDATSADNLTNNQCLVYKPTQFHTYLLEWTPTKITISVDGTTCLDHTISAKAPLAPGAPFDRPFNINLTQMLGSASNAMPAGGDPNDATLKVDYVRVWK